MAPLVCKMNSEVCPPPQASRGRGGLTGPSTSLKSLSFLTTAASGLAGKTGSCLWPCSVHALPAGTPAEGAPHIPTGHPLTRCSCPNRAGGRTPQRSRCPPRALPAPVGGQGAPGTEILGAARLMGQMGGPSGSTCNHPRAVGPSQPPKQLGAPVHPRCTLTAQTGAAPLVHGVPLLHREAAPTQGATP